MSEPTGEQGFTLVEMVVSVVILGIVLTPLLNFFISSSRINTNAWAESQASSIAGGIMEEYLAGGTPLLAPNAPNAPDWNDFPNDNNYEYRLADEEYPAGNNLRQISVEVRAKPANAGGTVKLVSLKWVPQ